jgi:hypothetical protein
MAAPHPATSLDFVARLADAWDGKGRYVLAPYREHCALLRLAQMPEELHRISWEALEPAAHHRLLFAARAALELGSVCSWVLGA